MDFHNEEATGIHLHVGRVTQHRVQGAEEWVVQQEDRSVAFVGCRPCKSGCEEGKQRR